MSLLISRIAALVVVTLAAVTGAQECRLADESIPSSMQWQADGTYHAVIANSEDATDGSNSGPVLDFAGITSVSQSIRCPGTKLKTVSVCIGVPGTKNSPADLSLRVRRNAAQGEIVAERTIRADELTPGDRWFEIEVNQASATDDIWRVEIVPVAMVSEPRRLHIPQLLKNSPLRAPWVVAADMNGRAIDTTLWMKIEHEREINGRLAGERVIWSADVDRNVTVDLARSIDIVSGGIASEGISLRTARGEATSRFFGVSARPANHAKRYDLHVTDFVSDNGFALSGDAINVEWVRNVAVYWQAHRDGIFSDPLAPRSSAVPDPLDAPSNVTFLVTWRPLRQIPAAAYRGQVIISADGAPLGAVDVTLMVLDDVLPRTTTLRTSLFAGIGDGVHPGFGLEYPRYSQGERDVYEWSFEAMADARITLDDLMVWQDIVMVQAPPPGLSSHDVLCSPMLQRTVIDTGRRLKRDGVGVGGLTPWVYTRAAFDGDLAARAMIEKFWKTYYPILKSEGWLEESWTRLPDEFSSDEDVARAIDYAAWLRKRVPGLRIMATHMGFSLETRQRLVGSVDLWCPVVEEYLQFRSFYQQRMEAGEKVWSYIHYHALLGRDELQLRNFFWWLYDQNLDGCTYFGVGPRGDNAVRPYGVRQQSDTPRGDGAIIWAAPRELWRSIRLHRIRDGIEDYDRLRALDAAVAKAQPAAGSPEQMRLDRFHQARRDAFPNAARPAVDLNGFEALRAELDALLDMFPPSKELYE